MSRTPFDDATDATDPFDNDEASAPQAGGGGAAVDSNELLKLQAERDDLYQKLARAQAEFTNARKRLQGDKEQAVQYANASLIKSLLPVIDNFERALGVDAAKTDVPSLLKGMQIVHDQWLAELSKQQVTAIAPAPGDAFDPERMQALMQQADPRYADRPEPTVTQLLQKGYALSDRVLRPAQVAVSKTS